MEQWKQTAAPGLYRLYDDNGPTQLTSFVDRQASKADQFEQLKQVSWMPAQVFVDQTKQISEDHPRKRPDRQLPAGRLSSPTDKWQPVLADIASHQRHPFASYEWPVLDDGAQLLLEPGEHVAFTCDAEAPSCNFFNASEGDWGILGARTMRWPSDPIKVFATDRRLIFVAGFLPPTDERLESSTMMQMRNESHPLADIEAQVQATGRSVSVPNLRYIGHVRYEWIHGIGCRVTTYHKKKLFSSKIKTTVNRMVYLLMKSPYGTDTRIETRIRNGDEGHQLLDTLIEQVASFQPVTVGASSETSREIRNGTEAHLDWAVENGFGYSVPESLVE